jgi:nicotinamidase-related amidase
MNNSAIIIVDMLNDFAHPTGSLYVKNSEKIIEPIKNILDAARIVGAQVIYACDWHDENDPEFENWPKHCVKNTWGANIVDELMPKRRGGGNGFIANDQSVPDLMIHKNQLSAMTSFHFRTWLNEWTYLSRATKNRDKQHQYIYIVGVATEYCVKSLVIDLHSQMNPLRVHVVSDCIEGVDLKKGDVTEAIVDISRYAHFIRSNELISRQADISDIGVHQLIQKNIDIDIPKSIYDWK